MQKKVLDYLNQCNNCETCSHWNYLPFMPIKLKKVFRHGNKHDKWVDYKGLEMTGSLDKDPNI